MSGERGIMGYTERVQQVIYDHVFSHPSVEVGGVLVGARMGEGQALLQGSVRAELAEGDLTSLTFTHDAWTQIHAAIESNHPRSEIIGWYHSHPGHGIFLSNHDEFIHRNFFADPSCLALVVDPLNGREGLFGWQDGEIRGFWERETGRPGVNAELAWQEPALTESFEQPDLEYQAEAYEDFSQSQEFATRVPSGAAHEKSSEIAGSRFRESQTPAAVTKSGLIARPAANVKARGALAIPLVTGLALGVIAALGLRVLAGATVTTQLLITLQLLGIG